MYWCVSVIVSAATCCSITSAKQGLEALSSTNKVCAKRKFEPASCTLILSNILASVFCTNMSTLAVSVGSANPCKYVSISSSRKNQLDKNNSWLIRVTNMYKLIYCWLNIHGSIPHPTDLTFNLGTLLKKYNQVMLQWSAICIIQGTTGPI